MTRHVIRAAAALAAAVFFTLPPSPAAAQGTKMDAQPGASSSAPATMAPARKGKSTAPATPAATPGSAELTEQECRKLGGAVHTAPQCKATGTRCVIRLAGGQINAPCIDEVEKKN